MAAKLLHIIQVTHQTHLSVSRQQLIPRYRPLTPRTPEAHETTHRQTNVEDVLPDVHSDTVNSVQASGSGIIVSGSPITCTRVCVCVS